MSPASASVRACVRVGGHGTPSRDDRQRAGPFREPPVTVFLFGARCAAQSANPICFGRMWLNLDIFASRVPDRDGSGKRFEYRAKLLHPARRPAERGWRRHVWFAGDTLCQSREPAHSAHRPHPRSSAERHAMPFLSIRPPNPVTVKGGEPVPPRNHMVIASPAAQLSSNAERRAQT